MTGYNVYVNENVLPVCDMTGLNDNKNKKKLK